MFLPNDVIQYLVPARMVRVLWIDRERAIAWVFELGAVHALPTPAALWMLAEDVLERHACLLQHDPYAAAPPPPLLPARQRAQQARAWEIVSTLQATAPDLYEPRLRAALVTQCATRFGVSRASVLRYLRRFWERGQSIDALLPDYGNSGGRGKTRAATDGVKRGRPRKNGGHPGLNIDAAMRATFRAAAARYCALHPTFSRRAAYRRMVDEFYRGSAPEAIPSFGQFSYWLDKDGAPAHGIAVSRAVQHSHRP